jgi:ElaB/YqjD/DUF883 family membrane-anchored ribosome-binding protein
MSTTTESVSSLKESNASAKEAPTTKRAAKAAHNAIDETAARAEPLEKQIRERADAASDKLEASQEAAAEQLNQSLAKVESFVRGRPIAAAGIAFAAGVLATTLLRR